MNGAICVRRPVMEKELFTVAAFFADFSEEVFLFPGFLDERFFLLQVGLHREIRSGKVKGVFVVYFLLHLIVRSICGEAGKPEVSGQFADNGLSDIIEKRFKFFKQGI